ncbi:phage tail protein [Paenibacillus illinoisensis]|uniref:tail fiber protein n=1 Tax=Paenibacillus illinoisensis TaxID=59845 RepID=UPI001C8D5885|nr:phage tail protein [Paenibacillus illinoisensis]MBY0219465.1 tail fiber protein [Paenibacillus illinoisensis]
MPQETDRLKLPLPLGNENVTRESINGIFQKIDAGAATQADLDTLREAVSKMDIPDASLTQKGKVQLSSKTDGTSEAVAATEKAVRDARVVAETNAKNTSLPRSGGSLIGDAGVLHLVGSTHVYQGFLPAGANEGRKGYLGFGTPGGKDFTIANEYGGDLIFRDKNGVTTLSDLKQSVSNGKASIAAAITGKGVPTAADATFTTMATNITHIDTGLKFNSGTVSTSGQSQSFQFLDGGTTSREQLIIPISIVGFRPKMIIVRGVGQSTFGNLVSVYSFRTRGQSPSDSIGTNYNTITDHNINSLNSSIWRVYELTGSVITLTSAYINDIQVVLPIPGATTARYVWEAYSG